jgi:Na+/H+ antiporter NhaD/arsenite permease-like protein
MLLGGFAKMDFGNFFFYYGKPSIFFAVELGALFSFFVLYLVFRKLKEKNNLVETEKITSLMPTYILLALIILLTISSFLNSSSNCAAGTLCMIFGFIALLWEKVKNRGDIFQIIKFLDWETTFFLIGVFVLVGGITITGWIENVSDFLAVLVGNNVFWGYTMLVFTAVILSAFIDNVPFLAAMLPVAITMSEKLGINQSLLMFGLLIGASLGGNITPIGASANIVACGLLKKEGYPVKFGEFVNLGLPFTLIAVFVAYVFVWVIWS